MNHPYAKVLQDTLATHKKMLDCLEKRLTLIHIDYATKNEHEKNEIEIIKIKTHGEIDSIKKVIKQREEYFVNYMKQFAIDVEECEKEYETVLDKAKSMKDRNMIELLTSVNWKGVDENIEVKIKLYQRLKALVK
jgi:uncharacterized protein YrzB (UPF0473 family)